MGCMSWIAGKLLCLFNIFFFVCGGVLLGICIYLAVDTSGLTINGIVIPGAPSPGVWAAAVYTGITVSSIVFVVGFLGCCGVRKDSQCMLKAYTLLVTLCILLEIIVAILALVFNTQMSPDVEANMQSSIKTEYTNPNATTSSSPDTVSYNWNLAQTQWQCCGSVDYTDYYGSTFTASTGYIVPYECCVRKPGTAQSDMNFANVLDYSTCQTEAQSPTGPYTYLYGQGCYSKSKNWVQEKSNILIIVGFTFAGLQVLGLLLAKCYKGSLE